MNYIALIMGKRGGDHVNCITRTVRGSIVHVIRMSVEQIQQVNTLVPSAATSIAYMEISTRRIELTRLPDCNCWNETFTAILRPEYTTT